MLTEEIKRQMFAAMKAGDNIKKEILRVARGEIDRFESTAGVTADDDQVEKILRKLVKSNEETLAVAHTQADRETLSLEIEILQALLPQTLGVDELVALLAPVADLVKAAGSDGQATGVAMKHVKANGLPAQGNTVASAVKRLRGG